MIIIKLENKKYKKYQIIRNNGNGNKKMIFGTLLSLSEDGYISAVVFWG